MKTLVCYPMKSLVNSFLPDRCDALTAENVDDFFRMAVSYKPEAVVLFSEMFPAPVWEWVPAVQACLPNHVPTIIVPLCKDEALINIVVKEAELLKTYVLSPAATHEELRSKIGMILGLTEGQKEPDQRGTGSVYALMSYGASGITTFCINYPILLAKRNPDKRIAVIDMNGEKPDLTRFFKLQQHQLALYRPDLLDLTAAAKRNWAAVCKQSSSLENLYYANGTNKWRSYEIYNLIEALRHQFDYVYIDWGYCFPETEALQRMLLSADRNLFFVRADPFSVENAKAWIKRWADHGIQHEVLVSHFDKGIPHRIGEGISVYGVVPRISDNRLIQSHLSHSVLVEEFFPPKQYINSLQAIVDSEKRERGAVIYR
jgi:cellulose biosynthesis protein BcsQ